MYLGSWKIDDLLTFTVTTTRFDTGAATDADSAPTYRVYEDETATPIVTGTMALLDSSNTAGFYSEQITLSAANGFEKGKSYNIYITAAVNSVTGATERNFQMEAEVDVNTISATVNVTQLGGSTQSATDLKDFADTGYDPATHKVQGVVLTDTTTDVTNSSTLAELVDGVWDALTVDMTTAGSIGKKLADWVVGTIDTYTGNTKQTGDAFARLGAPAGASVSADIAAAKVDTAAILDDTGTSGVVVAAGSKTGYVLSSAGVQAIWDALTSALSTASSIGKLLVDNINATISSRLASASYTAPPTAAQNADAVWDETLADHLTAGSTGAGLNAAGSAGDPWNTALPGAYGAGSAGKIVGDNLNATVSSRASQVSVDDVPTNAELSTALGTADDAVLAAIAALNNLSQANVRTAVGLASANLDTQLGGIDAKTTNLPSDPADESLIIAATTAISNAITALNNLSSTQVRTEVDAALDSMVPDSVPADGSRPSIRQAAYISTQFLLERAVAGTVLTVKKPDGSTALITLTLDDATAPTSVTRSA